MYHVREGNIWMSNEKFNLIDLFAGAGGLSNGFEQTGYFDVKYAVEINEAAQQTYIYNHGQNNDLILKAPGSEISDITQIDFKKVKLDSNRTVVIGGPPCQGFSNANRQKNYIISNNNQLVKEFVRVIRDVQPIAFLIENVKSINSPAHKFFVTKYDPNNLKDFSSKIHLDEISKEDENKLYRFDHINLLTTEDELLKSIVSKFSIIDEVPSPIIDQPLLNTRLRVIERKLKGNKEVNFKTNKEIREVKQILNILKLQSSLDNTVSELINLAIDSLKAIICQTVITETLRKDLLSFIEFNRFLTRCKELKDENIDCDRLDTVCEREQCNIIVKAEVKSYNVVDYLERVFRSYGYSTCKNVLDAAGFGVPQRRKRFFMMGIKTEKKVELPKENHCNIYTVKDAIFDLQEIEPQHELDSYDFKVYKSNKEFTTELTNYYRDFSNKDELYNHINPKSKELSVKRFKAIQENGGRNFHNLSDELKGTYTDASRTQNTVYLRLNYTEPSPTVINVRKSMWQHPTKARALSVREAARLQSFKDNFVFKGKKDQQYQQVGNAVPPMLAKAVAEKILSYLKHIE